jgi:hypothetical protein
MSNLFVSTKTDVYFLNTTTRSGRILLPSAASNDGYFLTFKDVNGTFNRSTITFSTLTGSQTFEDGSFQQTYNDRFGAYTFLLNSNKWYLTGGSRMNTAIVSTVFASSINTFAISTPALYFSTLSLPDLTLRNSTQNLYVRSNTLFFGSNRRNNFESLWGNAWGGARTAIPLTVYNTPLFPNFGINNFNPAQYQIVGRADATGGTKGSATIRGVSYITHSFPVSGTPYTFTITKPGYMEFLFVGPGGRGGSSGGNTGLALGAGGGGGGFIVDTRDNSNQFGSGNNYITNGFGYYCKEGVYTVLNTPGAGGRAGILERTITSEGINWIAEGGCNGENSPSPYAGLGGGWGGFSGYEYGSPGQGGFATEYAGGGGGAASFYAPADAGSGGVGAGTSPGGAGNSGAVVQNLLNGATITVGAGGGGGGGGGGAGSLGGAGGSGLGGRGGNPGLPGANTTQIGCGGGGAGGQNPIGPGIISGGTGGNGLCQIRYTFFSTLLYSSNYPGW